MRPFSALVTGIALSAVIASPAVATTVTYTPGRLIDRYESVSPKLEVTAGSGEVNTITLDAVEGGVRIHDDAGIDDPLSASCTRTDSLTVVCPPGAPEIDAGDQNDSVTGLPCDYPCRVKGGDGDDHLRGIRLDGGAGDDLLESTAGAGVYSDMVGGPGDDVLEGGEGNERLYGGGGKDRLIGGSGQDNLSDGDSSASPDADVMDGGAGAGDIDQLYYEGRDDGVDVDLTRQPTTAGAPGEGDQISGFERVFGGAGPDRLTVGEFMYAYGGDGDDVLIGDDTEQNLYPGSGRNEVRAGGGGDWVAIAGSSSGPDRVDLGDGFDILEFGTAARLDLANPDWPGATDYVINAEQVIGSQQADLFAGTEGQDTIDGGEAGPDVIIGRGGDDWLGGSGDGDTLLGGDGSDTIRGALGDDLIRAGPGDDEVHTGFDDPEYVAIGYKDSNRAFGEAGADRIYGAYGGDTLLGGTDRDVLYGSGGADVLSGGDEVDLLYGGPGGDRLLGGPFGDVLFGEGAGDVLIGGLGADDYSAGSGPDRIRAVDGEADGIDCGSGRDAGRVDRRDAQNRCEDLRVARPTRSAL